MRLTGRELPDPLSLSENPAEPGGRHQSGAQDDQTRHDPDPRQVPGPRGVCEPAQDDRHFPLEA